MLNLVSKPDFYGGRAPEKAPAYSVREVADFLQLPKSTVRSWTFGTTYTAQDGTKRTYQPIIRPADKKVKLLSFENLIEIHVLSSLRRQHKVQLDAVRKAVSFLRKHTGSQHPLAENVMLTDGTDVFVDRVRQLSNVSQEGQQEIREVVLTYLTRIERSPTGVSIRLFPVTRDGVTVDAAPKVVAIDPRYRFGQPFVVGCGVETRVIAGRYRAGDTILDLAADFEVDEDAIDEAIRYELRAAA